MKGIDDDWSIKTINIGFEYVSGSHTGVKIKKQYDEIIKLFDIEDKIFKIVCDQAANNKKAFKETLECTEDDHIIKITNMLIDKQRKLDMIEEKEEIKKREQLEKEISNMNRGSDTQAKITQYMKRDKVLLDLDDLTDELSQVELSDEEANETDLDADDIEDDDDINSEMIESVKFVLAFLPCGAHLIQLVIKDGLVLDDLYTELINHISKNIVSKSKVSTLIAEEIRKLEISLHKNVITRWNSILFMIRSVLKLTDKDFKTIRNAMRNKTTKQKEIKANFNLSDLQREQLIELQTVLEMFEFVTDELQCKFY